MNTVLLVVSSKLRIIVGRLTSALHVLAIIPIIQFGLRIILFADAVSFCELWSPREENLDIFEHKHSLLSQHKILLFDFLFNKSRNPYIRLHFTSGIDFIFVLRVPTAHYKLGAECPWSSILSDLLLPQLQTWIL